MTLTVTDLFCGGGGSSTGAMQIPGIEIRMAANHWQLAVDVHNQNHPDADHAAVDLHEEDPRYFPRTDILWASPECTKWSQASGGKYTSVSVEADLLSLLDPDLVDEDPETAVVQRSRLLMFDVLRFAEHHRYAAMVIENVVDIATNPKYCEAWALWKKGLRNLGYEYRVVSLNSMHAQAHGDPAPQSRDRLYIVCWLAGNTAPDIDRVLRPLAWCTSCETVADAQQSWKNGRTVGKYRSQYVYVHAACGTVVEPGYLPAAAAIDWTLTGTRIGDRPRPLAEKTRRRIAAGIARYWSPFHMESGGNQYDAADPKHPAFGRPDAYYRAWSTDDVLRTLHTMESKALIVPLEGRAGDRVASTDRPLRTQTSRHLDALVQPVPFIAELRGGGSTARPVDQPAATFTASGNHHGLVLPYYGATKTARPATEPLGTLTTVDRYALIQRHNSSKGDGAEMLTPATEPYRTLTTTGHQSLITPGDITAAEAQVDDCLFRMLEPTEVAAGMAFPADYHWHGTRRERVKLAGNAVTPPAARDLIAAVAASLGADIAA
ncbi:DNA cytosine methyltransferase [Nocardioides bruguierae]|uniref:DNA (cytosine-5-)-methyltransferase n=1 Tax=Nocardioides bruguierae TaxID=2945102 RepID=A0A9X2IDJ2_9ACTN|nr:DNA cytosine methyltransferase [Nocardioides bruguierae]MCM0619806.1 DNA cytosine methyltransferase [Nocardioides bruguierae]